MFVDGGELNMISIQAPRATMIWGLIRVNIPIPLDGRHHHCHEYVYRLNLLNRRVCLSRFSAMLASDLNIKSADQTLLNVIKLTQLCSGAIPNQNGHIKHRLAYRLFKTTSA